MSNGFSIRPVDSNHRSFRVPRKARAGTFWANIKGGAVSAATWLVRKKMELGWKKFVFRIFFALCGLFALYIFFLWLTLPKINEQTILSASQSTVITDRNGIELYRIFGAEDRTIIPNSDIPEFTKNAIISIEDRRYFERNCIDFRALARAVLSFGNSGGASTITRQLARNALSLQRESLLSRKIKEFFLGCQLESQYSKEDLLALYLNWIPFGQNAYGVEQASSRYFGKPAKELTLSDSAVLASLPQLPSYYSPYGRHVRTKVSERIQKKINEGTVKSSDDIPDDEVTIGLLGTVLTASGSSKTASGVYVGGRADQVLRNMTDQGFITEEQRVQAVKELLTLTFKPVRENIRAPHFVLWAKDQIETLIGSSDDHGILEQGGLTIRTTLDWRLQEAAEQVIAAHKEDIEKRFMGHNVALVAMDPATREILAYVGNTDYGSDTKEGKIDMAQVPRQPGSSFKAFVYAAAFQNGYGPATVLYDVPTSFGDYAPQNFEGSFWGLMSARRALGSSRNIPAVKAYFLGGEEDDILDLADKMGIPSAKANKPTLGYGAALAIGAAEIPLVEMVNGFSTLANQGTALPVQGILKVTDRRGALLFSPDETGTSMGTQALDPRVAYEVTSILSDPSARPNEYWRSVLSVPGTQAAAKTGTSNKCLQWDEKKINCLKRKPDNVWTLGYTPVLATGVWVGNATSDPLSDKADGLTVAAPVWKDFMARAQKILKPAVTAFTVPDGIVQAQVSLLSGELPTECTPVPLRGSDVFLSENAPSKDDPACITLEVDRVTGLLASESCPAEAREKRSFIAPYNAAGAMFPQWETSVVAWAKAQAFENPRAGSGMNLFLAGSGGVLPLPLAPTQKCDIALTPGRTVKPTLSLLSPAANGTVSYPSFVPKLAYTVGSRVESIRYEIDGKVIATVVSAPWTPSLRVPKTVEKTGTHTFTVTLIDQYFNAVSASTSITFSQDSSGPSIQLTEPADGLSVAPKSTLLMRAQSDDAEGGGVKYVEFFIDGRLIVRKPKPPYEVSFPLDLPAGSHSVKAVATDEAGNTAEDEVTVTIQ